MNINETKRYQVVVTYDHSGIRSYIGRPYDKLSKARAQATRMSNVQGISDIAIATFELTDITPHRDPNAQN